MFGLFKKKKTGPKKPKSFEFSVNELSCIGDRYKYTIDADSREEAFKQLVKYFYGADEGDCILPVKSDHWTISRPIRDDFTAYGMPFWFARLISGTQYGEQNIYKHRNDLKSLRKYASENDINLKYDT